MIPPVATHLLKRPDSDGLFRARRKHDIHTGMDLHVPEGTPVVAMEAGQVVKVLPFTGPEAGSPWWLPTQAVLVEGLTGVLLYGEIAPCVQRGVWVGEGEVLGTVTRVLRHDKGRPTSMLHLEWYENGTRECCDLWKHGDPQPKGLRDPETLLVQWLARPKLTEQEIQDTDLGFDLTGRNPCGFCGATSNLLLAHALGCRWRAAAIQMIFP